MLDYLVANVRTITTSFLSSSRSYKIRLFNIEPANIQLYLSWDHLQVAVRMLYIVGQTYTIWSKVTLVVEF